MRHEEYESTFSARNIISAVVTGIIVGWIIRKLGLWGNLILGAGIYLIYRNWDKIEVWMHSSDYLLD